MITRIVCDNCGHERSDHMRFFGCDANVGDFSFTRCGCRSFVATRIYEKERLDYMQEKIDNLEKELEEMRKSRIKISNSFKRNKK